MKNKQSLFYYHVIFKFIRTEDVEKREYLLLLKVENVSTILQMKLKLKSISHRERENNCVCCIFPLFATIFHLIAINLYIFISHIFLSSYHNHLSTSHHKLRCSTFLRFHVSEEEFLSLERLC